MISVNNITLHFGGHQLFDGITFGIGDREKIALIGANGAGKSTLLKVLNGEVTNYMGSVSIPKGESIGYLAQHLEVQKSMTVRERAADAFQEVNEVEGRIGVLEKQLSDPEQEDYESAVAELVTLTERLNVIRSNDQDQLIEQILKGLGFDTNTIDSPLQDLSGGWKMRVELARLLLQRPSLLLLDEPTNHLDIVSIQWLENFFKGLFRIICSYLA